MAVPMRLLASLLLACWFSLVFSFNLEPRIPIVKKGSPHSHFGYTVAQHQTTVERPTGEENIKSWILVGAPKDRNLQPGTNRSGALWKCPLTTNTSDCVQVVTDGLRNLNGTLYEPVEDEIKDGQWLGVTLKSQGPKGKVLVCAHRYMHKGPKFQWGFGLCYILSNNLDVMDNLEPCRGKPVNYGHQQYGYCQAGTSGLLLGDEAVLGVPGPFTWRGTVHTSNISDDFLLKDKTQYFGPVTEPGAPVKKYSYLGYSVTAGRFFGNYMTYVGGAPRSSETGEVVFLSREKVGNSLLRVDLKLKGEMFASSFGYEVLALDINGDQRDDLVVGAPFYFTNTASGAIYIYMNNDGGFQPNHPFTKIEGAPGESRFGSSMTSLGDLNLDGYLDIAVGAPYEGRGVIYIFLGSRNGLVKEAAQVIRAEDMPGTPYNAFGYSLSGGMDLDENGYPDLLASSFCSDRVLLLRARPIIDIETRIVSFELDNIDPSRKGCRSDPSSSKTCFSFKPCFKMDNTAGTRTGLGLRYIIKERPYQDRPLARVRFEDSSPDRPSEVYRNINLRPDDMGTFQCSQETVYLLDGSQDILRPLRFKLTYEIIQKEPHPVSEGDILPDINEYPILNQKGALRYFEGTFAKECGADDVCMSDLHVNGSLDLEYNAIQKRYLLKLGEQDTVPLLVEVTNSNEPAYESSLLVTHDKSLVFDPIESEIGSYQCSSTKPGIVKCGLGNPLVNTTGPMRINFRESGEKFTSRFIYFSVQANSSSTELTPQDPLHFSVEVIKRAEISIIGSVTPEQVFYGGEVVGESAIKHFDEIGMEVTHKYVVENNGPWRVDELQVEVLWPYQVENGKEQGKWLLYMTDYPIVVGDGECEIDPKHVNPLKLRRSRIYPDTFTGLEGDLEKDTSGIPGPPTEEPTDTKDIPTGTTGSGGVKITKTTTTKKVTTTSIKKKTTKTSSEKDTSETVNRSSSSSSSSSSSGSVSSSSSSSSSSTQSSHGTFDDNVEGSGFDEGSTRVHGRTHTRISRRVFSSSDGSRFDDNDLQEKGSEDKDEDGHVISHYERTHHSSGTSPDGRKSFQETRHESRKVTANEYTNTENIPSGRWGQSGGYRHTNTENRSSSRRTYESNPEETRTHWETRQTYPLRQDDRDSWSKSDSSGMDDRREESWREHGSTHTVQSSTRGTHSGGYNGDNFRRTHEGGAVTRTHGNDNSYFSEDDRRIHTQDGRDSTDRFVWTDENNRPPHDRRTGFRTDRGGNVYYQENPNPSGEEARGSDRYGSRRVDSQWSRTEYRDRSSSSQDHRSSQGHDEISPGQGHRSSQGYYDDMDESGQGYRGSQGGYDYRSTSYHGQRASQGEYDRSSDGQGYRTSQGHDDRSTGRQSYSSQTYDDRSFSHHRSSQGSNDDRTKSSQDYRNSHRYDDRQNYEDTRGRDDFRGWQPEGADRREGDNWRDRQYIGNRRYDEEESRSDGHTRSQTSHNIGGDVTYRGNYGSHEDSDSDLQRHRSHSKSRTSTLHSSYGSRQDSRGFSHHPGDFDDRDNSERHYTRITSERRFSHFDSDGKLVNGTYIRAEVDPETGETSTYRTNVYNNQWPTDSKHRSTFGDSTFMPEEGEKLARKERSTRRVKREKEVFIKAEAVTDEETGKTMQVVNLRCDGPKSAKCFAFRCTIRKLGRTTAASIRIKSRLWNATLVEDYPRVSFVSIKSKGSLILPEDIRDDQSPHDDVDSAETLAYPDLLDQLPPEEVPLWVILVSIFAGILLLIIIVLILWKLGFFERKRPDPTLSGNLDTDANGY